VKTMALQALRAVETENTRFWPKGWENTYYSWLREPKDWCISRQLWWGHRIPVFACQNCQHQWADISEPSGCPKCNNSKIVQDPDVLDTWFSSGLWPLTMLGWPNKKLMQEKRFDHFFPTSTLVTGYDIIFFWVARMMMFSLKFTGKIPFNDVYIHAIVRDKLGRKMSKSLNNGIDPLEMIDKYGADALRFALAAGSGYNRNLNLDPERIEGYRNFMNKIWNVYRFIYPHMEKASNDISKNELDHHERWIISELVTTAQSMNSSMDEYRFDDACSQIYSYVYDKFCSWFIELSKPVLNDGAQEKSKRRASVLKYCFKQILALLHPVCPFMTEELWQNLKSEQDKLLIISDYPEFDPHLLFSQDQESMNKFIETVSSIRFLRASVNIKPKDEVDVELFTDDEALKTYYESNGQYFFELARVKNMRVCTKSETKRAKKTIMTSCGHTDVFLKLEGVVDLEEHKSRISKELEKAQNEFNKYQKKLENKKFMENAPEDVVLEVRSNAENYSSKVKSLEESLAKFNE